MAEQTMSCPNRILKSLIYRKYDSESQMARELGWSRQKLNKIKKEGKEPTLAEAIAITKSLNISFEEGIQIFLSSKSPNGRI